MSTDPYKIRFRAEDGRDLTPRDDEDYLAFEEAAGVLLAGQRVVLIAVIPRGLDGTEVPGLAVTMAVMEHQTQDHEPDRGVMLSWGGLIDYVNQGAARAMLAVMEQAQLLADLVNSAIRVQWFAAREAIGGLAADHG